MRWRRRRRISPCLPAKSRTPKPRRSCRSRSRCSKTITLRPRRSRGSPPARPPIGPGSAAIDAEIASYEEAEDSYFRARASDLRDLRDRVLRHLAGEAEQSVPAGAIVAADDMPPSTFLATDWRGGGLVLRRGSPSSHVAILARSRGVPMIVGVDIDRLEAGAQALLDGDSGHSDRRSRSRAARRLCQAPRRAGRASKGAGVLHRAGARPRAANRSGS